MIREATIEDAAAIARVHVDSWRAAYAGLMPDSLLASLDIDQRAAGWTRMIASADRWPRIRVVELEGYYVHPDSWGAGARRALMDDALARLREMGCSHAYLWVLEGNARTIAIYEHFGWRLDGLKKSERRGDFILQELRVTRKL